MSIGAIGLIITGANLLITLVGFLTIKFNDLKHLELDVKTMMNKQTATDEKVNKIVTDVAVLKERTNKLEEHIK